MHPTTILSKAIRASGLKLPEYPCDPVRGICALTGVETSCLPRKHVLGKAFTNIDALQAPLSDLVGVDVFIAWNYGYQSKPGAKALKKPERMSSWFCDGGRFEELTRVQVREKVLADVMPSEWAGYATTSYKKHGSLAARVNTGAKRFWAFETRAVDCTDMRKVAEWWGALNHALRAGIGRQTLESLNCPPFLIGKIGLKTWMDFERWAKDKYLSSLYSFLCYLLPSQEELKKESAADEP